MPELPAEAVLSMPFDAATPWRTLQVREGLSDIHAPAHGERFGLWDVRIAGLSVRCHDLLSFYYSARDIFEGRLYDFTSADPAPRIIDGGAHIGLFTLFAKQKYPKARVLAFEPNPLSLKFLRHNLEINQVTGVEVAARGLYDRAGRVGFCAGHSDDSSILQPSGEDSIETELLSLRLDQPTELVKLNIEGAECAVIEEAGPALAQVRQALIEYHGFPELPQTLHRILAALDRAGFCYLVHDMPRDVNPVCHPPFRLGPRDRFFQMIYACRQPGRGPVKEDS